MKTLANNFLPFYVAAALCLPASRAAAQEDTLSKPKGHAQNKQLAARAYEDHLKKFAGDTNILVRPGLIADRMKRRVEVMVERTSLGADAPCEFTVIDETSDHGYEALLLSFAKPSDVHRALQFIGTEPGGAFDPGSHRHWARGESFVLSVVRSNTPPLRLEQLLIDRRTGRPLTERRFVFSGSKTVPAPANPLKKIYAADEFQPKSIVSLFNTPFTVLDVPGQIAKEEAYQNTIINPGHPLPEGALLTLLIEPLDRDGSKRVKDLRLQVHAGQTSTGDGPLSGLRFQLKDAAFVLNAPDSLLSVVEALAVLDRKKHDHFLTVAFGDTVTLGQAGMLAQILATIDREQGVRIGPPPPGQIYYRAFTPDRELLDRDARMFHPVELALSEKDGQVAGQLLLIDSVWKKDATRSELQFTARPVSGPAQLRQELDAEADRTRQAGQRPRLPVLMVFAPANLSHQQLIKFLDPALSTHRLIHVYLDVPMPPVPDGKPSP